MITTLFSEVNLMSCSRPCCPHTFKGIERPVADGLIRTMLFHDLANAFIVVDGSISNYVPFVSTILAFIRRTCSTFPLVLVCFRVASSVKYTYIHHVCNHGFEFR